MLVSLKKYAEDRDKCPDTVRRLAEQGRLLTARKIGRNWVVDSDEKYPCTRANWTIASLFSGCGGLDLGFLGGFDFLNRHYTRLPFDIVWANELNPAACKTYERNLGSIIQGDVNEVMDTLPAHVDVVIGGFPCQDISINGKMQGIKGKRSSLYTAIVEAVKITKPEVFVAENVGSLFLKTNSESFHKIVSDFDSLGYKLNVHRYDSSKYGVPQTRDRVFIVGVQNGLPDFVPPAETTPDKPITAAEAIGDLVNHPWDKEFAHIWSKAKKSGEQGDRHLIADRPGYTIRAECHGNIQWHYDLPRRISMREAARIQSFPDTFQFVCGLRETERQIGNAVPPVLAWELARNVALTLGGISKDESDSIRTVA
jgi:DNA (cytosine-5)-methyltransferase 1